MWKIMSEKIIFNFLKRLPILLLHINRNHFAKKLHKTDLQAVKEQM